MLNTLPIQLIENSEECKIVKFSEQYSQIQVRKIELKIFCPSGHNERLTMISLYNPQNGLFWWDYTEFYDCQEGNVIDAFLKSWFIHISDNIIACFRLRKFGILFRASCKHYDVFDDAYKSVISTLSQHIEEIEKSGFLFRLAKWYSRIDLNRYIPSEMIKFCDPWGMLSRPKIKMEITRQNSKWYIELIFSSPSSKKKQNSLATNAPENNTKKAILILNENFEVLNVIVK